MMSDYALEQQELKHQQILESYEEPKKKCEKCNRYLFSPTSMRVGKCSGCRGVFNKVHYSSQQTLQESIDFDNRNSI